MSNLSKLLALGIALLACTLKSYTQTEENLLTAALNRNVQLDFLSYKATPVHGSQLDRADFQPVIIKTLPISIKVTDTLPVDARKDYFITDEGGFRYSYPEDAIIHKSREGSKPITMRTFYLEASRNGIIPQEISYQAFCRLSIDQKQALLRSDNQVVTKSRLVENIKEGMITYKTSPQGLRVFLKMGDREVELSIQDKECNFQTAQVEVKYLSKPRSVPLIVKTLTDPFDKTGLSGSVDFTTWKRNLNNGSD